MAYILMDNIEFGYPKHHRLIKDISLEVFVEDFTVIIGPNGGGKTTLGKLMSGILKPQKGSVFIDEIDSRKMSLGTIGKKVGYLFQNPERQIFAPSVYEELEFPLALKGEGKETIEKKAEEALSAFQLTHLSEAFPFTLSQGEKQRLALAAILINRPKFLILDEPTTGLDMERKKILSNMLENLKEEGVGIVAISHDEAFVKQHATRIIEVAGGEVIGDKKNQFGS